MNIKMDRTKKTSLRRKGAARGARLLLAAAAAIVLLALPLSGQSDNDPNFARGVEPNQFYQDFGTDNVNLLNGNVTLSIPIGPEIKHNGDLSFQLSLNYNSKIWETEFMETHPDERAAFLEGRSPVGLGWSLHAGCVRFQDHTRDGLCESISDEIYFETPDGTLHRLFPRESGNPRGYWETRDSSYLRAEPIYKNDKMEGWIIRYPSGVEYKCMNKCRVPWTESYSSEYTSGGDHRDRWGFHDCYRGFYTTEISDPFGNKINISYKFAPRNYCLHQITFVDVGGVNKVIEFDADDPGGTGWWCVTAIRVPGFEAANKGDRMVEYTLTYQVDGASCPTGLFDFYFYPSLNYSNIPRLRKIDMPVSDDFTFGYNNHGELTMVTYPTGATVNFSYYWYPFGSYYTQPKYSGSQPPYDEPHLNETRGVISRTYSAVNEPNGAWSYLRAPQYPDHYTSVPAWVEVSSPHPDPEVTEGIVTRTSFGFKLIEVQPPEEYPPLDNGKPVLVEYFDEAGKALKWTKTSYVADKSSDYWADEWIWHNVRSNNTVDHYATKNGASVSVTEMKSDYQGFGHYGEIKTYDGFTLLRREVRSWETTQADTENDFYENWFIDKLTSRLVYSSPTDDSLCSWTVYTNEPDFGLTTMERRYRGGAPGDPGARTRVIYSHDLDTGSLIEEKLDGGWETYTIRYEYEYGQVAKKFYNRLDPWFLTFNTIHGITGKPIAEYGPGGLDEGIHVAYNYDDLGRLVEAAPEDPAHPGLYKTSIAYDDTPGDFSAHVQRLKGTALKYTQKRFYYNTRGKIRNTFSELPGLGVESCVTRTFGPLGHKATETVPGQGSGGTAVTTWDFDALGRIRSMTTPDTPAERQITYTYNGLTTTVTIPTDAKSETVVKETRDGLDRIVRVEERVRDTYGSSPDGWYITEYDYDAEDRLLEVDQWSENDGGLVTGRVAMRSFTYDYEGNLRSSTEPETGTIEYTAHDPYGNVGKRKAPGGFITEYTRDNSARLVGETLFNGGSPSFVATNYQYDQSHAVNSKGRLTTVTETAESVKGDYYRENYYYGEDAAAISKVEMTYYLSEPDKTFTWQTIYNFNQDGLLRDTDHPHIAGITENRLATTRAHGTGNNTSFVTAIKRGEDYLADSISYNPAGGVAQVVYGSETQTYITPDSQWRPLRIEVLDEDSGSLYNSGAFQYDGLGRITDIGGDAYAYDSLSRLTRAWVEAKDGNHDECHFSYDYDLAGNMTGRAMTLGDIIDYPDFTFGYGSYLDVRNRIVENGFVYDGRGNLTQFIDPASNTIFYMEYNAKNWITRVAVDTPENWVFRFHYDHRGRRVMKADLDAGKYTFYLRDHLTGNVLTEYEYDSVQKKFEWKAHNAYMGRKVFYTERSQEDPAPGKGKGKGTPLCRYYHHDHLGSPVVVADLLGAAVSTHKYAPFGVEMPDVENEDGESSHRFTGHERDRATGLDYMIGRYYGSSLGRFLSVDPVPGEPGGSQGWNRYAYVRNDPLNQIDPEGKQGANPMHPGNMGSFNSMWKGLDDLVMKPIQNAPALIGEMVGSTVDSIAEALPDMTMALNLGLEGFAGVAGAGAQVGLALDTAGNQGILLSAKGMIGAGAEFGVVDSLSFSMGDLQKQATMGPQFAFSVSGVLGGIALNLNLDGSFASLAISGPGEAGASAAIEYGGTAVIEMDL